jgi:NitT/TauT family transport system substrate-binding protein
MALMHSRRDLAVKLSAAGAAALLRSKSTLADEPPPETTAVRLIKIPGICIAPQYVAEELLRAEGFTDILYVLSEAGQLQAEVIARGDADFSLNFAAPLITQMDAGGAIKVLAGVHPGCFELFANERVRSVLDLKGKSVGVQGLGSSPHLFLAAIATHVGLDPAKDINWVLSPSVRPKELFAEGKIDAFLGFPPEPQELRARKIGHVVVNSAVDRPWSQYFCCMLSANADFIERHPVATKRVLRAILKSADLCVAEPERVAKLMVDGGFSASYEYALQTMGDVPYARWREFDPEDTIRFYALRLHEAGIIRSSPKKIVADGTDWRFLNELKRELKA